MGIGMKPDTIDSSNNSSNVSYSSNSDVEKQRKPHAKKAPQFLNSEEMRIREDLDEQSLIDQKNASNMAAEALIVAEQENLRILDQLDEGKQRLKDLQQRIKELEQELQDRDYEIKHYRTIADDMQE